MYKVSYSENAGQDVLGLDGTILLRIKQAIETRLALNPQHFGKPLQYAWKGHRRVRVGDYRTIYRLDDPASTMHVVAINHRRNSYEG